MNELLNVALAFIAGMLIGWLVWAPKPAGFYDNGDGGGPGTEPPDWEEDGEEP